MNIRGGYVCVGLVGAMVAFGTVSSAQSVRSLVREGNEQYKDKKFSDAEVNYRKALEKEQDLVPGYYNLGNSLYKQNKSDEAVKEYESAVAKSESKKTRAEAYYNMGNALMKGQHYPEAVKSYIESLKLSPYDQDTKYNLSYALEKMRQQQQQQQNKNDKNKGNKKDQQKDQKQDQNQQKQDQQKQNQQQEQQNQQAQQQKQQNQDKKMAKAEAERILDVLKNDEKDIQKKLRVRPAVRAKTDKDW